MSHKGLLLIIDQVALGLKKSAKDSGTHEQLLQVWHRNMENKKEWAFMGLIQILAQRHHLQLLQAT